jgi:hypothetical protein
MLRARAPAALALALAAGAAASLGGCGGDRTRCAPGQLERLGVCYDRAPATPYLEVAAPRATCPPPTQVAAGEVGPPQPPASCGATVRQAEAPAEWVTRFPAPVAVGTALEVQVPAGAASLTIVLQAVDVPVKELTARGQGAPFTFSNTAVPLTVEAPDGSLWWDDTAILGADPSNLLVFFGADAPAVGTLTIPNTARALEATAAGVPAGAWRFTVSDYAWECATIPEYAALCGPAPGSPEEAAFRGGTYDVTVIVKPGVRPATGTLDVSFFLQACPGGEYGAPPAPGQRGACLAQPLTSASAPTDPDAQRMLASFASLMANAGVCVGEVRWYDLPPWAQDLWSAGVGLDGTPCESSLDQLFALSPDGRAMNLFLVPTITTGDDDDGPTQVVGVDGTIPGPSTLPGTIASGAAVSTANLREGRSRCGGGLSLACGADVTAYIAAHEAGHFLGLFHTTEAGGTFFDPLTDTQPCRCECANACSAANGRVTGPACTRSETCGGGKNLMFWLLDSTSAGIVSPQQAEVIRANPLVR